MVSLIRNEKLVASTRDLTLFDKQRNPSQATSFKTVLVVVLFLLHSLQVCISRNVPTVKITSVALCQRCGRALAVGDAACATNRACDGVHTALSKETGVFACSKQSVPT